MNKEYFEIFFYSIKIFEKLTDILQIPSSHVGFLHKMKKKTFLHFTFLHVS